MAKVVVPFVLGVPAFALGIAAAVAFAWMGFGPDLGAHIFVGWAAWALFAGAYLGYRPLQVGGALLLALAAAVLLRA